MPPRREGLAPGPQGEGVHLHAGPGESGDARNSVYLVTKLIEPKCALKTDQGICLKIDPPPLKIDPPSKSPAAEGGRPKNRVFKRGDPLKIDDFRKA